MSDVPEKLEEINKTLKEQKDILKLMLDIMPKPTSKLKTVLETLLLIVGVSGIIFVIDVIINWFGG